MHTTIPVVLGGFGEGRKCITDKTIAEIHGMKSFHIRELIVRNMKRFKDGVDILDLKRIVLNDTSELLQELGYAKQAITQAEHIYLLSERGYAKLIKIMDTDLAWDIHDKLMDEYFTMRDVIIPNMAESENRIVSEVISQMSTTFTKYFVDLESSVMGLDSRIKKKLAIKFLFHEVSYVLEKIEAYGCKIHFRCEDG